MINFYPSKILLSLGPVQIYYYGFIISLALISGFLIFKKLAQKAGFKNDFIFNLSFWLVIFGIIGARLYHVFSELNYYLIHPLEIFYFWHGGMGIYGAVIAGVLVILFFCKKNKSQLLIVNCQLFLLDLLASALVVAQAIGRWGNYFNSELFGRPSNLPWAIPIAFQNRISGFENFTNFHPTFLYESLWCLFIFIFLFWRVKKIKPGLIFLLYIFLYSLGRFLIEFLRIDYQPVWLGLRLGHWTSLILIISSIIFYFILRKWYNLNNKQ